MSRTKCRWCGEHIEAMGGRWRHTSTELVRCWDMKHDAEPES